MGRVAWLGKYDTTESTLVTLLRKAGAVLYTKTSVCQTLLSGETCNNIIARTSNPRNNAWSAGGSSGGEGALIALRGSVLGVGTDTGTSLVQSCRDVSLTILKEVRSVSLRHSTFYMPSNQVRVEHHIPRWQIA